MIKTIIILALTCLIFTDNYLFAQEKIQCPDTVVINSVITSYGFDYKDIDTIKIKTFIKNSGFKKSIDSFYVYTKVLTSDTINHTQYIDIGNVKQITNAVDWEIILKKKLTYKVSEVMTQIITERHQFKRCKMVAYTLNGIKHKGMQIELVKPGYHKKTIPTPKSDKNKKDKHRMIL